MWQQVQAGDRVLAVTFFADAPAPGAPLSPFARELHARWDRSSGTTNRRREDVAALSALGVGAIHWPYADCIYRQALDGRFLYANEEALWGEIHPEEEGLIEELVCRLAALPLARGGTVYPPLGVGHHVDHRIVRRAAEFSQRTRIYYEEFPYAEDSQAVQAALAQRPGLAQLVHISEEALEAKIAAIARYRSQLSTFWDGTAEMAAAVRAFAERTGGAGPAERYWQLDVL